MVSWSPDPKNPTPIIGVPRNQQERDHQVLEVVELKQWLVINGQKIHVS
jgi:hypothetical protein